MTLDSSGNLLVGTTTASGKLFSSSSSASQPALRAASTSATYADNVFAIDVDRNTSNNTFYVMSYYNNGAAAHRFRIADSGAVATAGSISIGSAVPATSGIGVQFPATQSASSDANTLDDYEEGTFTPTLVGFSTAGTTTYATQTGLYTKIGRQVTYIVNLVVTATTGTGAALLGGFPFTFNSTVIPVAAMDASALNWTGGTYLIVMPEGDTTTAFIYGEADDASRTLQNLTNETQVIRFTLTHFV
jgi:hypothetical protein